MSLTVSQAQMVAARSSGMSSNETVQLLELLVSGTLDEQVGGDLLKTWAWRGESSHELAATVRYLRGKSLSVPVFEPCFDLCGTGGSGLTRYNISTTVAFVLAAAGVPVAKHGNRGSQRPNGSFDLLDALDVPFLLTPVQEAELQRETGLCFIFARTHHVAVGKVVPYRKYAACRGIFNLAGPLANPANIKRQLIGTVNEKTARIVAEALVELKSEGALVVWGSPGIDEISITGKTGYFQISESELSSGQFDTPSHSELDYGALPGGDAPQNAKIFLSLLGGSERGPLLDMVCVNAGAAIDLWKGSPPAFEGPGCAQARKLIANGKVMAAFEKHRTFAQGLAQNSQT